MSIKLNKIMIKPSIPKGTRDFSPVEMAKRNYIFNTIQTNIKNYLMRHFKNYLKMMVSEKHY